MSLVLYNDRERDQWVRIHESAMTKSMAAGAFSYAIAKMAGDAATSTAKQGISILGLVLAFGAQQMGDEVLSKQISGATNVATTVVQTWGQKLTTVGSAMMCATTAAVVGSGCMIGKMAYELWNAGAAGAAGAAGGAVGAVGAGTAGPSADTNAVTRIVEQDGTDFVIYEIQTSSQTKMQVPLETKISTPVESPLISPASEVLYDEVPQEAKRFPTSVSNDSRSTVGNPTAAPNATDIPRPPQRATHSST